MNETKLFSMGFSHCFGIGPHYFQKLLHVFQTVEIAYKAPEEKLAAVLGLRLAKRFTDFRAGCDLHKLYSQIHNRGIFVIDILDPLYPAVLKLIPDPPICLYVRGLKELLNNPESNMFAIVGTRNPTSYGEQIARHFASRLAEHGFIIVSGLALGIDAIAHTGTMDVHGKTIAVLGCGVDIVYPPSNRGIYNRILAEGGCIISEFPPGHTVQKGLFIVRNRVISGLSQGVLVVEGTDKSGTLTTAKYAAEQGKIVFAPPVPITSLVSQAPNLLLKQGAVLVTGVEDILQEFGIKKFANSSNSINKLSEFEKRIVHILEKEDSSIDELVILLHSPLDELSVTVSQLEMNGLIEKNELGKYRLRLV